jgi:N-methylhydantoinase A
MKGLSIAGERYGMSLSELLGNSQSFVHGSTVCTNALIERKTAKVGLICTKGFRDILTFGEKGKDNPFSWDLDNPEPFVPRYLVLPVTERIDSQGSITLPLVEDDVVAAAAQLRLYGVEAIAVCLLWSVANPVHEQRVSEILERELPDVPIILSSELNPVLREYRRTSSTVVNASLIEVVRRYLGHLAQTLRESGYRKSLSLATCSGGIVSVEEMLSKPIYSINSGPSMAPIAGKEIAELEQGTNNVITLDMGGTSFDVSVVRDGRVALSRETSVGDCYPGINMIDSRNVGAGGGSIARVDSGGLVHVGPESAGAVPGPACYARGGQRPTVTDADLILGYLDAEFFLGGRMKLEPELSRRAIERVVAEPLEVGVAEGAFSIWTIANHHMLGAIQDLMVQHGIDPRQYAIVAGGGALGMHIGPMAKTLGVKKVIIPKAAGVLSAFGGAFADIVSDYSASFFTESTNFAYERVNSLLADLNRKAEAFLLRHDAATGKKRIEFYVEARYPRQIWELEVLLGSNKIEGEQDVARIVSDFHAAHERVYAVREPGQRVEFVHWGVRATAFTPKPQIRELEHCGASPSPAAVKGSREAYFRELGGYVSTPIYNCSALTCGNRIAGPAILEEDTTTIVVFPSSKLSVTKWGNYLMEFD